MVSEKNANSGGKAGAEGEVFSVVGSTIGIKEASDKFEPLVRYEGHFVTARLDGNGLRVEVKGIASYGDRTVTAASDVTDKPTLKAVEDALRDVLKAETDELRKTVELQAMQAAMSAAAKGEEI